MDRYQKVEKPKAETPINENELRITALGRMRNYISYAMTLLQEKGANEIVLKATGRAINKTVMIAELIKRRIAGLHQNTSTGSIDITDTWEPLEEGLLPLETTRHVSIIMITLSKKVLDSSSIGYQPPIPTDQVKASAEIEGNEGEDSADTQGKGHVGQGKYGGNINGGMVDHRNGGWDGGRGYGGRGQGCGRGRGSRGRGRGYGGEICSGIQDITTVMIHQDHCLARVVVDVGEDEDEDVVTDLLVKVSDLMVHSRKLLEHLQKYGFKLKPNLWMAAGLYALFKALIANLIGKRPYLLFSRPQFLREIGR
ncbi:hypothetical protein ES332_D01G217000v1 [Gossypium tomentosum]|uniref:DNA/RNA-binding protein Alba-like domain-containing protein n=1 Tax=Gossypium tomentosum TaxID=34277 RepID=A0A5D2MBR8_GOSTO|nr:hypothetical protein ES332_D01G217000v1 [Gossypium tomentosum]